LDRGSGSGRDAGEEALLELARLIGSNNSDPFEPEHAPDERSEPRLGDVSRVVAAQSSSRDRRDRDSYDQDDRGRGRGRHDDYAASHGDGPGHLDDDYDDEFDEPDDSDHGGGGGRRPMRASTVVLALVVLGGAGAWGYRTMVAAPSQPPIIHADNSPTKIAQMSDVRSDSRSGRVGEQVVRREESPVDVGGGTPSDDTEPAAPGEPRHVRTVPIRADQGQGGDRSRSAPAPASAPPPPAAATSRQVVDAPPPPPPPRAPVRRQAAVTPPPADAAPPADATPTDGSYVVQLTAVKTEADAQSEFHRLQTKYASVLGGHQPLIRRKDKGDQVFYAAGVGGFGAKGDADQFCEQFKAAGGKSCYVYKN